MQSKTKITGKNLKTQKTLSQNQATHQNKSVNRKRKMEH